MAGRIERLFDRLLFRRALFSVRIIWGTLRGYVQNLVVPGSMKVLGRPGEVPELRIAGVRATCITAPTAPSKIASVRSRSRMPTSKNGRLKENPTAEPDCVNRKQLEAATSTRYTPSRKGSSL